jgi:hypothetical protein
MVSLAKKGGYGELLKRGTGIFWIDFIQRFVVGEVFE